MTTTDQHWLEHYVGDVCVARYRLPRAMTLSEAKEALRLRELDEGRDYGKRGAAS